jgi:hypothetical protein
LRLSFWPDMAAQCDGSRGIDRSGYAVGRCNQEGRRGKGDEATSLDRTHLG